MDHLGALGDDGVYVVTARALASDEGYRIASLPDGPWQTKYPILFPLALAALMKAGPDFPANLPLITAFCWALLPVFLLLSRRLAADFGLSERQSWLAVAMLGLNPMVLLMSASAMPEILFSCFLTASLVLVGRAAGKDPGPGTALAAGLCGAAAYLTKTSALPLLVTAPAYLLWRRQGRKAAAFVGGMLPAVAAWACWTFTHNTPAADISRVFYTNYLRKYQLNANWTDLPQVVLNNVAQLLQAMGGSVLMMQDDSRLLRLAGIAVLIGLFFLYEKHGLTHCHLFVAAYCLMLLVLPYTPNERFLVPVMPVLLIGVTAISNRAGVHAAAAVLLGALCVTGIAGPGPVNAHLSTMERTGGEVARACDWIGAHVPEQAAFISAYDTAIYLHSGRHGIAYTFPTRLLYREDRDAIRRALEDLPRYARANGLDYVLTTPQASVSFLGEWESGIAEGVLQRNFDPVYRSCGVSVYRRRD